MKRFILTGTPGAGKTAILRQLEIDGFGVVEEAATDIIALQQAKGIAEPWGQAGFVEAVVDLQKRRLNHAAAMSDVIQFHDRSAICTAALAAFLGLPLSDALSHEIERLEREAFYQRRVFFIRSLGFVTPTEARKISLEEARLFEKLHEETYYGHGFDLIPVEPGSVLDRVAAIRRAL
jgi:predicted ATPase